LGVSHYLEHEHQLLSWQYKLFGVIQNPWPRPLRFRDTVVVMIDDDAYYKDTGAERPLSRTYLANMLEKISEADPRPAAIGLDVLFTSPDEGNIKFKAPGGHLIYDREDVAAETEELIRTVNEVTKICDVVLIETLVYPEGYHPHDDGNLSVTDLYHREFDVYDGYPPEELKFTTAYDFFYDDRRSISPTVPIDDGKSSVDSLSLALARSYRPDIVKSKDWTRPRVGSFVVESAVPTISAYDLMHAEGDALKALQQQFKQKIVLIGGNWHQSSTRNGPRVDQHETPIGLVSGVLVHANHVEAILDDRVFDTLHLGPFLVVLDVLFGFLLAYVSVIAIHEPHRRLKQAIQALTIVVIVMIPLLASFFLMEFLAIYWDVVILDVVLLLHLLVERLLGHGH
jgi:hypothetical protein